MIETKDGTRNINEVMLVPDLDENLLSGSNDSAWDFLLVGDDLVGIFEENNWNIM